MKSMRFMVTKFTMVFPKFEVNPMHMNKIFLLLFTLFTSLAMAQAPRDLDTRVKAVEADLIKWRRHIHEYPELSNREFNTGKYVADALRSMGLEVKYPVAKTGVVGILKGGKPGATIGIRADMDALPITERADIPFASKVKAEYNGAEVGVMHACGHDAHTAILMATARVLKDMQKDVPGTVVFIFQPAEEGPPNNEEGGAPLMIKEGVMDNPKLDAIFGLHMAAGMPAGALGYKAGAAQASSDLFTITVQGKGNHGALPWYAVDPIAVATQIYQGLQQIVSRQSDLTKAPLVITVGFFHAGVRNNIIPETAVMKGTIRALDKEMRLETFNKMKRVVNSIAESAGATATLEISGQTLVVYNDPDLVKRSIPSLTKAAGSDNISESRWTTAAEDFSFFGEKAPSFYFSLGGGRPTGFGGHHTPDFLLDESGFVVGVRAFCQLVFDQPVK
jgi:amidohydrolase